MKRAVPLLWVLDCLSFWVACGLLYIQGWRRILVLHPKSCRSSSFVGSELDCDSSRSPCLVHRAGRRNPAMGSLAYTFAGRMGIAIHIPSLYGLVPCTIDTTLTQKRGKSHEIMTFDEKLACFHSRARRIGGHMKS
jgi:hypothetical protein